MSASPVDHVKDIPYAAISKNGGIIFPKVTKSGHSVQVEWPDEIMGAPNTPAMITVHGFSLFIVSLLLIYSAIRSVRGILVRPEQGRGVSSQLFEVLVKFIRDDVAKPNLGPHGDRYYPMMLTFFFMILFANLWGMVPLLVTGTATGNINVTAALAIIVLGSFFILGMKEQGIGPFWKNLAPSGLPVLIYPLLYPIEFIGPFAKCFALCIRLFANMVGGHIVLAAIGSFAITKAGSIDLVTVGPVYLLCVAISMLEVFVAFLQAYIFTLLSCVFLGAFIHPDH